MNSDSKISDLSNDVKIKAFEVERIQIVYDEAMKNFRESQLENDKTTKKLEVSLIGVFNILMIVLPGFDKRILHATNNNGEEHC